ncbi:hypothetical protein [Mycobacterium sp. MS1601]|nr:hypothetical protein [Mycobacterium sp. MS1601]
MSWSTTYLPHLVAVDGSERRKRLHTMFDGLFATSSGSTRHHP